MNFERVYRDSKLVKAVSDEINVKFKKRTALLEKADKEIRTLREQLQKEALTMGEAKKRGGKRPNSRIKSQFHP